MALILDESWDRASPRQVLDAGYVGVIGYVGENTTGKNITRSEIDAYHRNGIDVGFVYEYQTNAAHYGAARGARNGVEAVHDLLALGAPAGVCAYAAVDYDPPLSDAPHIVAYMREFKFVCNAHGYRAGTYGSHWVCETVHGADRSILLWQTYAWSHGEWSEAAAIRQVRNGVSVAGHVVDRDVTRVADWGQWRPDEKDRRPPGRGNVFDHWHNVKRGDKGRAVCVAQGLLIAAGLGVGSRDGNPDGVFGRVTEHSTRVLQQRRGIAVDGIFGDHTLSVAVLGVDIA